MQRITIYMDLTKYEHSFNGKKYVLYPGKNPKYLIITFSCIGKNYNRTKQFWNDETWNEYSYLFLVEPESHQFVINNDHDNQPSTPWYTDQCELIDFVIKDFDRKNVFTLGFSLGSFAALYHGIRIKAGIVLCTAPAAPGFTFTKEIDAIQKYIDFKSMLNEATDLPDLYIESSSATPDHFLIEEIINICLTKKIKMIIQKELHTTHCSISLWDRNHVYRTIDYFLSWRQPLIFPPYDWLSDSVVR